MSKGKVNVLFVCMGNICRSPTAEGVFRKLVKEHGLAQQIFIDSAGTHSYHNGSPPDERAMATAQQRGIDLSTLRSRPIELEDFDRFDYLLAMDRDNETRMRGMADGTSDRIHLFLSFASNRDAQEVPDPYYGGDRGFEDVFDMIEDASSGLLEAIRQSGRLTAETV